MDCYLPLLYFSVYYTFCCITPLREMKVGYVDTYVL